MAEGGITNNIRLSSSLKSVTFEQIAGTGTTAWLRMPDNFRQLFAYTVADYGGDLTIRLEGRIQKTLGDSPTYTGVFAVSDDVTIDANGTYKISGEIACSQIRLNVAAVAAGSPTTDVTYAGK